MPYYDTIEDDLKRARELLEKGKPDPVAWPPVMEHVAQPAGGTIYGADIYPAYKLLESFVAELTTLRDRERALCQYLSDYEDEAKPEELLARVEYLNRRRGIEMDARMVAYRGLREAAAVLDDAAEIAGRNEVPQLSQTYAQAADECRRLATGAASPTRPSFTCPLCGMVSYHPKDIAEQYCGRCHAFHGTFGAVESMHRIEQLPPLRDLRYDDDQHLDDVAIEHVRMFRMERMDTNRWWMRLDMPNKVAYVFEILTTTPEAEVYVTVEIEGP